MTSSNELSNSKSSFFSEHEECFQIISCLCSSSNPLSSLSSSKAEDSSKEDIISSLEKRTKSLQDFSAIMDKYLECSTLLDPYLEKMVTRLSTFSRTIIHEYFTLCLSSVATFECDDNNIFSEQAISFFDIAYPLSALRSMCKVRGRKKIQKFLPHQVDDLEPVLFCIRRLQNPDSIIKSMQDKYSNFDSEVQFPPFWESIYVLLTWLEVLSLLPFDLSTLDSSVSLMKQNDFKIIDNIGKTNTEQSVNFEKMTLMNSIIEMCKSHLADTGPTREAASSCLARLLTRPDLEKESALETFVENYAGRILRRWKMFQNRSTTVDYSTEPIDYLTEKTMNSDHTLLFLVLGVIETLVHVFKTGSRTNLINLVSCMETIWEHCILLAQMNHISNIDEKRQNQPAVLRKLLVKLFARVGCAHLKPRLAEWRYERGRRSLLENLVKSENKSSNDSTIISNLANYNKDTAPLSPNCPSFLNSSYFFIIPSQIEDVTGLLLHYLQDPSTNIRYTAAKNLGRITERLPEICSQDILDAIFTLFDHYDDWNSASWHGGCLALAELARRGLLLPERLEQSVKAVLRAMNFDKQKNSLMVIGAQVRDAACYACWAFSRAYSPEVLAPYIRPLTEGMICAALFDRELNCRRAASAAFQEFVGRMGGANVTFGIEILTLADYFALGKREDAYRKVAVDVAKLGISELGYTRVIINALNEKVVHWDSNIRILASKALGDICCLDVSFVKNTLLDKLVKKCTHMDLNIRHGAILAVAEILLALGASRLEADFESKDNSALLTEITELVSSIEGKRLYRGKGGEIMRVAVARLVECISKAKIKLSVKQQVRLLDSVDSNLKHPKELVQIAGVASLHALTRTYFPVKKTGPSERLQGRIVDKYIELVKTSENVAFTRGFTLALGSLPKKLLAPSIKVLTAVINCLSHAAKTSSKVGGEPDAETRRNAINSLLNVIKTVGIKHEAQIVNETEPTICLDKNLVNNIFYNLLSCTEDYNTDRRGDVGSWSRIAAMTALEELTYLSLRASQSIPQNSLSLFPSTPQATAHSFIPCVSDRLSFLVPCEAYIKNSMNETSILHTLEYSDCDNISYFDDIICEKIFQVFFKQLSEKLDAVRLHAGNCLERMLLSKRPCVPFIPQKAFLIEALGLQSNELKIQEGFMLNWAHAASTYPLVMKVVNVPPMFDAIISGMIISVGGLTESVVRSSKTALFEWIRTVKKNGAKGRKEIVKLGDTLISLFDRHSRDGRVILPLLKTIDQLLSQGCLDQLLSKKNSFPRLLLLKLKVEINRCTDVRRLFAAIGVLVGLLSAEDNVLVQDDVFPFIMRLLGHRYPRVRCHVAEQLYIKLLEDDGNFSESCPHFDSAMSILLQAVWGEENAREQRNHVADLLGVKLSVETRNGTNENNGGKKKKPKDEFESYMSLIKDFGR